MHIDPHVYNTLLAINEEPTSCFTYYFEPLFPFSQSLVSIMTSEVSPYK